MNQDDFAVRAWRVWKIGWRGAFFAANDVALLAAVGNFLRVTAFQGGELHVFTSYIHEKTAMICDDQAAVLPSKTRVIKLFWCSHHIG